MQAGRLLDIKALRHERGPSRTGHRDAQPTIIFAQLCSTMLDRPYFGLSGDLNGSEPHPGSAALRARASGARGDRERQATGSGPPGTIDGLPAVRLSVEYERGVSRRAASSGPRAQRWRRSGEPAGAGSRAPGRALSRPCTTRGRRAPSPIGASARADASTHRHCRAPRRRERVKPSHRRRAVSPGGSRKALDGRCPHLHAVRRTIAVGLPGRSLAGALPTKWPSELPRKPMGLTFLDLMRPESLVDAGGERSRERPRSTNYALRAQARR
jgi:hypothetical protein